MGDNADANPDAPVVVDDNANVDAAGERANAATLAPDVQARIDAERKRDEKIKGPKLLNVSKLRFPTMAFGSSINLIPSGLRRPRHRPCGRHPRARW